MAAILIRQISVEEAEQTLAFFEANPHRNNCIVGLGDNGPMIEHKREDIPKLQAIIAAAKNQSPPQERTVKLKIARRNNDMPRYMETAAKANEVAKRLMTLVPEGAQPAAAEMIAQLVNLGIRCAPRAVQSTVRKNAVERAVRGLPVEVTMEQRTDPTSRKTYNALITKPKGGEASVEGSDGDDE